MLYSFLKWLHIIAAMIAVGSNFSYGIWIMFASRKPENLSFTLMSIRKIDNRIANPAYVLVVILGLLMVYINGMKITTSWILLALILFVLLALVGFLGYSPTLKRQIEALEKYGFESENYRLLDRRGTIIGAVTGIIVLAIIYVMVTKPILWT